MHIASMLLIILSAGLFSQWLAWRIQLPAIVILITSGLLLGPVSGIIELGIPQTELTELIGLGVAIILFEGGMDLKLGEIRRVGHGVGRLTILGPPFAWVFGALAAHYIAGLSWPVAWVLGAILVVTGPTVILPLLRQARLNKESAALLKWEGIVNDPTGVLLAVLTFQYFTYAGSGWQQTLSGLGLAILAAAIFGGLGGWITGWLYQRGSVPAHLKPPALMVHVLAAYWVSNLVQHEAGLLTVTVMGLVIGNMKLVERESLRHFKENLTILLLAVLFIIIPSQLKVSQLEVLNAAKVPPFIIEDETREELYSDESNDYRRIKIQIWYPAESVEGYELAPWLDDGVEIARGLSKDMGFPFFVLDHTADIMSNAYINAPINNDLERYPVVIISHGWRGFRNIHTDFAEELASNGYIVVGIDHTYGSVATVFDDDDVVHVALEALPQRETTPDFLDYANQLVYTYAGDITTTINYLEVLNDLDVSSRFNGKLDLTTIGLVGHSTGGGAGVAVALDDERIDAVVGLDSWVEPINETNINQGLEIPALFLRSESWEVGFNNTSLLALIDQSSYDPLLYQIDGTTHFDFAMVYMYSPLTKYIGFSGEIDSEYLNVIMKTMILDFFAGTLGNPLSNDFDTDEWEEVKQIR